jgi:hypothetical protein
LNTLFPMIDSQLEPNGPPNQLILFDD